MVRRTNNSIEYAQVEVSNTTSSVRLEMRHGFAGTLVGWNADGSDVIGTGTALRYHWFAGSTKGTAPGGAALAIEMNLANNNYVLKYDLSEDS